MFCFVCCVLVCVVCVVSDGVLDVCVDVLWFSFVFDVFVLCVFVLCVCVFLRLFYVSDVYVWRVCFGVCVWCVQVYMYCLCCLLLCV